MKTDTGFFYRIFAVACIAIFFIGIAMWFKSPKPDYPAKNIGDKLDQLNSNIEILIKNQKSMQNKINEESLGVMKFKEEFVDSIRRIEKENIDNYSKILEGILSVQKKQSLIEEKISEFEREKKAASP